MGERWAGMRAHRDKEELSFVKAGLMVRSGKEGKKGRSCGQRNMEMRRHRGRRGGGRAYMQRQREGRREGGR